MYYIKNKQQQKSPIFSTIFSRVCLCRNSYIHIYNKGRSWCVYTLYNNTHHDHPLFSHSDEIAPACGLQHHRFSHCRISSINVFKDPNLIKQAM